MKISRTITGFALGLTTAAVLWIGTGGLADDSHYPGASPGKEHAFLEKFVGTWEVSSPMGTGVETATLTCGGLWLVSDFKGSMMGQDFSGHGIMGYDPEKKKYVGVWVDSMQAHLSTSEGEVDPTGKVFTAVADEMKMIDQFTDDDTREFSMIAPGPDGQEATVMTLTYKRKKS